jgi:hypothetical protein
MTCDHCKRPIEKGAAYSVTEYGRLHSECLRSMALGRIVIGPRREPDPVYVLRRMEVRA